MFTARSRPAPAPPDTGEPLFGGAAGRREDPADASEHDAEPPSAPTSEAPDTTSDDRGSPFDEPLFADHEPAAPGTERHGPPPADDGPEASDGAPRVDDEPEQVDDPTHVGDPYGHLDEVPSPSASAADEPLGGEVVVSDIPPARHPTSDDIAALTSELTRLAAEAERDEHDWAEPVLPADEPPPTPTAHDVGTHTVDTPAAPPPSHGDGPESEAWWEMPGTGEHDRPVERQDLPRARADHDVAEPGPTDEVAAREPAPTDRAELPPTPPRVEHDGGHGHPDEPQPWVGHTDDLDRPPPVREPAPYVPVTRQPPSTVHDAHDGARVSVTGTSDDGHLVVRVEPPSPDATASEPAPQATGAAQPTAAEPDPGEPTPTGVHAAAHERAGDGPRTRVHGERLDNRPGPIRLSPSEAVALAEQGPAALRRERPSSV